MQLEESHFFSASTAAIMRWCNPVHSGQIFPVLKLMTDETLYRVETSLSGYELLNDPLLNKGTAFTEAERDEFDLHGLLPPHVSQLDSQVKRRLDAFRGLHTDMQKYTFLRGLQDSNEILFYALLTRNIEEMMPIVYTPTVGLGCQHFSSHFP